MAQVCPICNNQLEEGAAACKFCGFRIPGSTQSFQPVKVQTEEPVPQRPMSQKCDLRVIRGPQTGMQISLNEGIMKLGRDPKCDIFLNDMTVSREHAELEISERGCVIRDLDAFNGVWVNDRMVDACLLKSGDIIQLGAFCLIYKEQ